MPNPADANTLIAAAQEALARGAFDEALAHAQAAVASAPSVMAYQTLAQTLLRRNDPLGAQTWIDKAIALAPGLSSLLLDKALLLQAQGKSAEATECYRQYSSLHPEDGYARELLTQGLLEQWLYALHHRRIGRETSKAYAARMYSGFFRTYLSGRNVLDIGYRGGFGETEPIVPHATGVDFGTPGYDGVKLPFPDGSQDAIYSSHCLEHIPDPHPVIREWFRVLRVGGYAVVTVPHQYLYERKQSLPSTHPGHCHFFTPGKLLALFEDALPPNHYRVRHLADNDLMYDYSLPPTTHPVGCYEIELVLEKIEPPGWGLVA